MKDIAYICDRRKSCRFSIACGKPCTHTFDPEHAANGPTKDPVNDNRFRELKDSYWEIGGRLNDTERS